MESKYLDKRVTDRYLAKGLLKRDEFEKYMKNLPDSEGEGIWVQMDLHDTEMTEDSGGNGYDDSEEV